MSLDEYVDSHLPEVCGYRRAGQRDALAGHFLVQSASDTSPCFGGSRRNSATEREPRRERFLAAERVSNPTFDEFTRESGGSHPGTSFPMYMKFAVRVEHIRLAGLYDAFLTPR